MGLDALLQNQLGHLPTHIVPFQGVKIELTFALRAVVSEIFKIAIFEDETWPLAKVPEVAHIPSFSPKGLKLTLFFLYGQQFPRLFQNSHIWA